VFNSDCLDDSEARNKIADHVKTLPAPNKAPRIMTADKFVEAQRATIKHIGSTACYSPLSDSIAMPAYEDFISAEGTMPH
jgi:antirestriction protein ArdC